MNLLDLVPAYQRQLRQHVVESHTDSTLAAYLADAVEALNWRWERTYAITYIAPSTYLVTPDITPKDKRAVVLMASIIYKSGNQSIASFRDGDFAYDPNVYFRNPVESELNELNQILPPYRLAKAKTAPMRGTNNIYNPEHYDWGHTLAYI